MVCTSQRKRLAVSVVPSGGEPHVSASRKGSKPRSPGRLPSRYSGLSKDLKGSLRQDEARLVVSVELCVQGKGALLRVSGVPFNQTWMST